MFKVSTNWFVRLSEPDGLFLAAILTIFEAQILIRVSSKPIIVGHESSVITHPDHRNTLNGFLGRK